jgi:hypothetical protein
MLASKSLASRRFRPSHAKRRSTTQRREPLLVLGLPDDLDGDAGGLSDALAGVGAVGEDKRDEGEPMPQSAQQGHRTVAVLHRRRLDLQAQQPSVGVDHGVALAPRYLLAGIVAARATAFRSLHALTVDDPALGDASRPARSRSCTTR